MNGNTDAEEAEIAQLVAKRLGWKLWDQALTEKLPRLAEVPHDDSRGSGRSALIPLYYRLFKSFLRGSYEGSLNAPRLNLVDSETRFSRHYPAGGRRNAALPHGKWRHRR